VKVTVSIPNQIFKNAERLARRCRKSRNRLFSDALGEYVARRTPKKIKRAMDVALTEIGEKDLEFPTLAGRRALNGNFSKRSSSRNLRS